MSLGNTLKRVVIMAKWKCEICGSEFENFHAQRFDNKIHCPLCFFKELYKREKQKNKQLKSQLKQKNDVIDKAIMELDDPFENEDGNASWYEIAETCKCQINTTLSILKQRGANNE